MCKSTLNESIMFGKFQCSATIFISINNFNEAQPYWTFATPTHNSNVL